ncbi:hypothetical protein AMTRI_Chr05g73330 [Amborella trichopoda]|uniref:Uncharacterized protein n=1 Tax=Amborella trichopoda TaxID=13333 RepID=W1PEH5_AMBTC|nr:uncharacterized protein LOC18434223 [Amborella trichopoda]ERN06036.1 hypothetical protein AMTR_s00142p00047070 [Amborella trichopoda]|eukprot:XP_006844361.1 uncharacterized protein LOC18434223 [Amborella trichopoda]
MDEKLGLPAPSPSNPQLLSETAAQLSSLVDDVIQQAQGATENMLRMISEIDESSNGITEEMAQSKESTINRKKTLEEERERFQNAAMNVLAMLTGENN